MVVETVVAAPSGPSATSSTWITMSRPLSAREALRASRVPRPRFKNAGSWPEKACKPVRPCASARRSPSPFGLVRCRPQHGAGEGDDGPSRSTATRDRSPRSRRGALLKLRPQRHYFSCASRRARRAEARPAPHPLRHVPEPPPDGGGAAAEMLADLGAETVPLRATFDAMLEEPTVLPSAIPQLLMNGSTGIAVGMATNIPPHNLSEVVAALTAMIDEPDLDVKGLLKHVK